MEDNCVWGLFEYSAGVSKPKKIVQVQFLDKFVLEWAVERRRKDAFSSSIRRATIDSSGLLMWLVVVVVVVEEQEQKLPMQLQIHLQG